MQHNHSLRNRKGTVAQGAVWLVMGSALLSMATGAGAVPSLAHSAQGGSTWMVNPLHAAKLGPEVKIVVPGMGTYGIRPPRGLTLKRGNVSAVQGGGILYVWLGPMQPDRTAATFMVTIGKDNSGFAPGLTSPMFVQLEMSSQTRTHQNSQVTAVQQGTIHGLPFARANWKGVGPRTGKMFNGFFYGQFVRPQMIMIEAKDEAPASSVSMLLFNAAALTLHKY